MLQSTLDYESEFAFDFYDEEDVEDLFAFREAPVFVGKFFDKLPENYQELTPDDLADDFGVYTEDTFWDFVPATEDWVFVGFYLKCLPRHIDLKEAIRVMKMSKKELSDYYLQICPYATNERALIVSKDSKPFMLGAVLFEMGWQLG